MNIFKSAHMFRQCAVSFITAFVVTMVLTGLLSVVFSFFHPSEIIFHYVCRFFGFFSSFTAAFLCAEKIGKNGLFSGIIWGDIYMAVLILCGILFFKNTPDSVSLLKTLAVNSLLCAIAGVMGINFKK